ncbi:hypothetical protein AO378_1410 [Moraxella catarrhalis]|nr:hypothetical protein AO378_1410 [Moraxella catarrhalis]
MSDIVTKIKSQHPTSVYLCSWFINKHSISPKQDTHKYLNAIKSLLSICRLFG